MNDFELPDYLRKWLNKKHTTITEDFLTLVLSPFLCFSQLYNDAGVEPIMGNDYEMGQRCLNFLLRRYHDRI